MVFFISPFSSILPPTKKHETLEVSAKRTSLGLNLSGSISTVNDLRPALFLSVNWLYIVCFMPVFKWCLFAKMQKKTLSLAFYPPKKNTWFLSKLIFSIYDPGFFADVVLFPKHFLDTDYQFFMAASLRRNPFIRISLGNYFNCRHSIYEGCWLSW